MAISFPAMDLHITREGPKLGLRQNIELIADDLTVDAADSGKILMLTATGKTITLPATAVGIVVTVMAASDGITLTISPNASDKILGLDFAGTDNVDIACAANKGDYITLLGDGSLGWYVVGASGSWAT